MTLNEKLFAASQRLPSLPDIVQQMIRSLADEQVDIAALVGPLSRDQALSARVLRLANSSFYASSRRIGAIDEAVTLIGLNPLRNIVIASGVSGAFGEVAGVNLPAFWEHAALSAAVARSLGRKLRVPAELCYTAALMHRVGSLLICLAEPVTGADLYCASLALTLDDCLQMESARIGTTHCELGAELARRWNFPEEIHNALLWYARPLDDMASAYALIVYGAQAIARELVRSASDTELLAGLSQAVLRRLALTPDALLPELARYRQLLQASQG